MNLFLKIGIAALAGAAVLFGINCTEKKSADSVSSGENKITDDEEVTMTSSPNEDILSDEPSSGRRSSGGFMNNVKRVHCVAESILKVVTCICRIFECIGDMFSGDNRYYRYPQGGTTIII